MAHTRTPCVLQVVIMSAHHTRGVQSNHCMYEKQKEKKNATGARASNPHEY